VVVGKLLDVVVVGMPLVVVVGKLLVVVVVLGDVVVGVVVPLPKQLGHTLAPSSTYSYPHKSHLAVLCNGNLLVVVVGKALVVVVIGNLLVVVVGKSLVVVVVCGNLLVVVVTFPNT
jgi:hypothetical protein